MALRGPREKVQKHSSERDDDESSGSFYADAPVDIAPREVDLSGEADDKIPNTLVITVLRARHIPSSALRMTPSCYVKLSSMGREAKTSVMTRTDEPVWNETFSFRAIDWASPVTLSVRDRSGIKMRFIGQVRVSAAELSTAPGMARQRWLRLLDKHWDKKVGEAEIELSMALTYSKRHDPTVQLESALKEEREEATIGIMVDQDEETEEEALVRMRELERRERERKSVMYANLKQGDYQVQVHIIEARDLKGENLSGTSDPYCLVEVLGTKKRTSTKDDTLGCVFDEILFFNFKSIGRDDLKQASINISVFDRERLLKDKLIGTYQLDCLSVYFRPNHELYRQWVAVHDHMSEKDRGVQGFLLITVIVIGPGDSFLVHDREAEIMQEMLVSADAQASIGSPDGGQSLVLLPPSIDLKLHFLLVKVFKAEDLPAMDEGSLLGSSGIDAYVQVGFAANTACKSSVVTVKGSTNLAPEFLDELWIPVMVPTLSRSINISVWDRDLTSRDELVGIATWDYHQVVSSTCPGGIMCPSENIPAFESDDSTKDDGRQQDRIVARWFNLYGPPLRHTNKKRAQAIMRHPDFGSTYRGRVLLSMECVESPSPSEGEKFHLKRMKETSLSSYVECFPKTVKYALRCALYCGVDIPQSVAFSVLSGPVKVRVTVAIGSYKLKFDPEIVAKSGLVTWEICLERWPIVLPADLTQVPDVIITLSRQVDKDEFVSLSYVRLSAPELFSKGFSSAKPQWLALKEEEARRQTKYALEKNQSPGSILLRLGFGREEVAARQPWGDDATVFAPFHDNFVHREIRVHVFQVRKLELPAGRTRLPSPFVSVRCCGQQKKTAPQFKTLDPLFYETIVFIVRTPEDLAYSPDVVIQLHDATVSSSTNAPNAVMGELRIPMTKATKSVASARAPRPSWFKLNTLRRQSSNFLDEFRGDVLISVQCIDHLKPIEFLGTPDSITPEYQESTLEIAALGVRKLKALSMLGIQHPHLEFELTGGMFSDGSSVRKTKPSVSSNGKNANFLDYIVAKAKLPMDSLYAPQLEIKVCEYAIGGLRKSVIASCKVDLSNKLPWSSEYVPMAQKAFENPSITMTGAIKSIEKSAAAKKSTFARAERLLSTTVGRNSTTKKNEKRNEALPTNAGDIQGDELGVVSDDDIDDSADKVPDDSIDENADDGLGVGDLDLTQVLRTSRTTSTFTDCVIDIMDDPVLQEEAQKDFERRYHAGKAEIVSFSKGISAGKHRASSEALALDGVKPPSYMQGRDWWISHEYGGEELENFLKVKALETYSLHRSVLTRPSLLKWKRVRVDLKAGVFKGLIRVADRRKSKEADGSNATLLDVERLREPQALEVRVYVLRASNLQSKDLNGYSDPYLRLKLGKDVISDHANYKKKTLNPDFFKMFSFNATLPGPSQLEIAVWDHDMFSPDDLIGKTTIDLEDRWFHRDWQKIGQGHPKLAEAGGCLKPIEYRHLYTDKRTTSQGYIQLWVDILTAQQAALTPPVSIDPPTPRKFEVRIIIWRGENIVDQDQSEINDYFVKVWMEGGKSESTDVHWRCSNGKPCWNWRLKLPVEFPLRTPEFGRLHVQLWDKDVLKWNDLIGEAQLDLYKWIRRAYEANRSVSPFYELRRQRSGDYDKPATAEPVDENEAGEAANVGDLDLAGVGEDDAAEDSESEKDRTTGVSPSPKEKDSLLGSKKKSTTSKKLSFASKKLGLILSKPSAADLKRTREAKEKAEAKAALNGFLDFMGLGELPEDAEWITIYYTDREAGASMDMGRLGISVQIVPELEATANPVGKGQDLPNANPYLPPPVGRFRISANPLSMLKELVGPKMCLRLTILCCCAGCVLFISVFGATIMSTLTYLQALQNSRSSSEGWILPPNVSLPSDYQFPH